MWGSGKNSPVRPKKRERKKKRNTKQGPKSCKIFKNAPFSGQNGRSQEAGSGSVFDAGVKVVGRVIAKCCC